MQNENVPFKLEIAILGDLKIGTIGSNKRQEI